MEDPKYDDDTAHGGGYAADNPAYSQAALPDKSVSHQGSRRHGEGSGSGSSRWEGFLTGRKDGMEDVSVSSKYSDKEVMHSNREDLGKGDISSCSLVPWTPPPPPPVPLAMFLMPALHASFLRCNVLGLFACEDMY